MRTKAWSVLAAGVVLQLIIGGIYAWSEFIPPLVSEYAFSQGQSAFIFGVIIAVFSLAMIPAGVVFRTVGPRRTAGIGALLYGLGYVLASRAGGSYPLMLISLGLISGTGIGFIYICPLSTGMLWFPRHKGLVTGVSVAGFGAGAIFTSMLADFLLKQPQFQLHDVFRFIGFGLGGLACIGALVLDTPKEIAGRAAAGSGIGTPTGRSMITSSRFLLVVLGMFGGTFAGLLVVGNLKPLLLEIGVPEAEATLAISLFAFGNAVGRVLWGRLFDHFGPRRTIRFSLLSLGITVLLIMVPLPAAVRLFVVFLAGTGFGSCFTVYALSTESLFGIDYFSRLYPLVFLGYGIAALAGPVLGGMIADMSGTFRPSLAASTAIVFISLALIEALFASNRSGGDYRGRYRPA
jgi:MFS transporter, OFA family, oxalate/formate antiporter